MRISDWSSDVCSSDLLITMDPAEYTPAKLSVVAMLVHQLPRHAARMLAIVDPARSQDPRRTRVQRQTKPEVVVLACAQLRIEFQRSEEHTSELQSLMRISYAVFCLKKNKNEKYIPKHL